MPLSKIESASLETAITADSLGVTGNLTFTGTGNRITGDFSNATIASRVLFQTSTANGNTLVRAIPNGTAIQANIAVANSSDAANCGIMQIVATSTEAQLASGINGTGTYLPMTFFTGGLERVRIDTVGKMQVGTSTARGMLHSYAASYTPATSAWATAAAFTASGTFGGGVSLVDGTAGWGMWAQDSGTTFIIGHGAINGALSEKMRIDSSGNLLVGTSSANAKLTVVNTGFAISGETSAAANSAVVFFSKRTSNGIQMRFDQSGTVCGDITTTGSSTSYGTSSDYRLKEAVQPMQGALAKVAALKPVTYTWTATGQADEGFIAHELQAVCPSAVTGEKDAVDADGNPQYQGIDTSFLVATLAAAIQELKAIVDAQGAEIAALKGTP